MSKALKKVQAMNGVSQQYFEQYVKWQKAMRLERNRQWIVTHPLYLKLEWLNRWKVTREWLWKFVWNRYFKRERSKS